MSMSTVINSHIRRAIFQAICTILLCECFMNASSKPGEDLTPPVAYGYVVAWARSASLPADTFKMDPNGDFRGLLRGVDFEYSGKAHTLIVRATVTPYAKYAVSDPL